MGAIDSHLRPGDLQMLSGESLDTTETELPPNDGRDEAERTSDREVSV